MTEIKVVANGAGAAGIAIIKLLYSYGVRDVIMCDPKGAIYEGRPLGMNPVKEEVAKYTNKSRIEGSLEDVLKVQMYLLVYLQQVINERNGTYNE